MQDHRAPRPTDDERGFDKVGPHTLESFLVAPGARILFVADDPAATPETSAFAPILPDLFAVGGDRLSAAIADRSLEERLRSRFSIDGMPALLIFRDDRYLGQIDRAGDRESLLRRVSEMFRSAGEPVA